MDLHKKNVSFRRGYINPRDSQIDVLELDVIQLSPGAPTYYVEKEDILTANDILDAEAEKSRDEEGVYNILITFSEDAIKTLNRICSEQKIPFIFLFIKGVPFYNIAVNGPFDEPTVEWPLIDDKDEAELLVFNLRKSSS